MEVSTDVISTDKIHSGIRFSAYVSWMTKLVKECLIEEIRFSGTDIIIFVKEDKHLVF